MDQKHGLVIAVVGLFIFIGFGAIMLSTSVNCGLGARDGGEENETRKRSDDQSWFSHFVCTGSKPQHNR